MWHALAAGALLAGALPSHARAQVDPAADYRTLHTAHFRVTYQRGLEALARHAAERAEMAHAALRGTLAPAPRGMIDIVLADDLDVTNGAASPLPSNRIWIYAKPPVDVASLAYSRDWIELVVVHELAHVFHLDAHGKLGDALRTMFGRIPFTWPVFPALGTPLWSIEGLAVQVESGLTGFGRIHGSWHETVVRTAILAGRPDPIDRISGATPIWPGDERYYIYGSLFLEWIARSYGDSVPAALVDRVASSWLPPGLFFDRIPRAASGKTFTVLYRDWLARLETGYTALADSLRQEGLTDVHRLTEEGYRARHPRFSPDGRRVAWAALDGRNVAQTRVLDARTGAVLRRVRRNSLGTLAWTPDGQIVTSQLEFVARDRYRSDLYRIDVRGREHRLTQGARLQDPDVSRDGRRIVAIRNNAGATHVELLDFDGTRVRNARTLLHGSYEVLWALPRFSPDGAHVAVSRSTGDSYGIVVVDTAGRITRQLVSDAALDMGVTWSPDGRWLLFSSDRSGIANLYAADVTDPDAPLRRITSVLGGAYEPDVAPDGTTIVFADYAADGFHIARIPFDTTTWRRAPPARDRVITRPTARADAAHDGAFGGTIATGATSMATDSVATAGGEVGDARDNGPIVLRETDYSPWASARPHFWLPVAYSLDDVGTFIGATSLGLDAVGRHAWNGWLAVAPDNGRTVGSFNYTYAGLGNPQITAGLGRDWDRIGFVRLPADSSQVRVVTEREDVMSARLGVFRPRTRIGMSAAAGGEVVRRSRTIENGGAARLLDPTDELLGITGSVSVGTSRVQPFSISREDGVALAISGRRRWDRGSDDIDAGYGELTTRNAAYQSFDLPGFARHVLALRANALLRTGSGAEPASIGGAAGLQIDGVDIGPGSLLLPVRGFSRGVRAGTRAWSATAEYRLPIALVGRGVRVLPFFLDRVSATVFADAGDAWCAQETLDRFRACTGDAPGTPLLAAGTELNLDLALFGFGSLRTRLGAAFPIQGPESGPAFYLRLGPAF